MWEVNWDYTRTVRSTAQSSSPLQFATYVPTDHWNPHQRTHNGGGNAHPLQPPLQFQPQIISVPPGSVDRLSRTLVDPSAAKLSDHHDDLSYGSTPTAAATKREGRRLQGSMSSDTGEKNFKCEACGRSYSRKAELDRHQGTAKKHNGTGKFACGCCGVWFTRSDARLRHERKCAMGEGSRRSSSSSESGRAKGKERDTAVDIDEYEEED
ncbi:hypothetical protein BDV93DRAFT_507935 [Ceratobasidium sp. AG-I]|nr:hypothetical protein BDV93DRAFT_507935 [Ceratobasidium sp. AG-I]